jgi:hypothetical protein
MAETKIVAGVEVVFPHSVAETASAVVGIFDRFYRGPAAEEDQEPFTLSLPVLPPVGVRVAVGSG